MDESTGQPTSWMAHERDYIAGIALLAGALFLSALLGLYQEHTYRLYGKQWKEALFYGVCFFTICYFHNVVADHNPCVALSLTPFLYPLLL